jgi:hypothetical protein
MKTLKVIYQANIISEFKIKNSENNKTCLFNIAKNLGFNPHNVQFVIK